MSTFTPDDYNEIKAQQYCAARYFMPAVERAARRMADMVMVLLREHALNPPPPPETKWWHRWFPPPPDTRFYVWITVPFLDSHLHETSGATTSCLRDAGWKTSEVKFVSYRVASYSWSICHMFSPSEVANRKGIPTGLSLQIRL